MLIKKIQNSPDTLVDETLEGYHRLHPDEFDIIPGTRGIIRTEKERKEKGKVKLVSGGGSGHEPGCFTMIGRGGYDLFVAGDVYAAPSWMQMVRCIQAIDDGSPILYTVSNHAGDVLNANMAMEVLLSKGVNIRKVIHYDDISTAPKGRESERRGLLGALGRITGVAAERGCSLDEVERLDRKAVNNSRCYGFGFRSAIHPCTGMTIMEMPNDEIEMGIGMHGESSGKRIKMLKSEELSKIISDIIIEDLDLIRGEEVAVLVNGLGGVTCMEYSIFYNDIYKYLTSLGIKIFSATAGNGATTQELGGILVAFGRVDDEIKSFWQL